MDSRDAGEIRGRLPVKNKQRVMRCGGPGPPQLLRGAAAQAVALAAALRAAWLASLLSTKSVMMLTTASTATGNRASA